MEKKESKSVAKTKVGGAKKVGNKVLVNEGQIDLFLDMIKTADVTSEENQAENATLLELEGKCAKCFRKTWLLSMAALTNHNSFCFCCGIFVATVCTHPTFDLQYAVPLCR